MKYFLTKTHTHWLLAYSVLLGTGVYVPSTVGYNTHKTKNRTGWCGKRVRLKKGYIHFFIVKAESSASFTVVSIQKSSSKFYIKCLI